MHVMKMCQAMVQEGHEVTLYAPRLTGVATDTVEGLGAHYGLSVKFPVLWLPSPASWPREHAYAWRAVRAAKSCGAELVFTRHITAAALAAAFGIPTVCEIHGPPTGLAGPRIFASFLGARSRRRLVLISEALRQLMKATLLKASRGLDIVVAHDGVDLERFKDLAAPPEARQALGLKEAFTVVYAGHLYAGRGIELLLELAVRLPAVQFIFVGGEPEVVEKRRKEAAAQRMDNAIFVGFVTNTELPRYLAAGDALAMPYQRQVAISGNAGNTAAFMSPLKMFEYLAAGRLIISSDLPVLREVLDDNVATLCPPEDADQWQASIQKAMEDPLWKLQIAQQARNLAEKYTWRERVRRCVYPN